MTIKTKIALILGAVFCFSYCQPAPEPDAQFSLKNELGQVWKRFDFPQSEKTLSLVVSASDSWQISISEDAKDWISISPFQGKGDGLMSLSVSANEKISSREGSLEVVCGKTHFSYTVTQKGGDAYFQVSADKNYLTDPGSKLTITVDTNYSWDYETSLNALELSEKTAGSLVLELKKLCYTEDRSETISIKAIEDPTVRKDIQVKIRCALALNLEFNDDGTAHDVSPNNVTVTTLSSASMMTYRNEEAGRNAVRFFNSLGGAMSEGFYKVDYASNKALRDALDDGHSLEVQFMMAEENPGTREVKMFSSMDAGGTGFLLPTSSRGSNITFLPNVSTNGSSTWRWTHSGVMPQVGKYYHVIGVWDKEASEARIYVNGELKGSASAPGSLVFPSSKASQWICVGGDPSGDVAEAAWNGDVVIARVYDAALDQAAVSELWKAADKNFSASSIKISGVLYLPQCDVVPGDKYTIVGDGFVAGDKIRLDAVGGGYSKICDAALGAGRVSIAIPGDIVSGTYKMYVVRGSESSPLGTCILTSSDKSTKIHAPKIVAHRGFHSSTIPENSIAALEAAQNAGFYGSETDIWITTDGVLIVNHDGVIGGKKIQDSSSSELSGATTFPEYLAQAKKNTATKLIIEVKEHSTAARNLACTDEMIRQVNEAGMADHVEYISFGRAICERIASVQEGATVAYLTSTSDLQGLLDKGINCADFTYSYLFSNPALFNQAHALGMQVNIWTIDSSYEMTRAIGLGADYITTNKPDVLKDIVEKLF